MILNDIKQKFKLINAYEDWKDYRQLLTDMVIDAGGDDRSKTVAVIGAGYCNDIDINRLCGHFKEIILLDCDVEALEKVNKDLKEAEAEKIVTVPASLTGIEESDISAFFDDTLLELKRYGKQLTGRSFEEVLTTNLDKLQSNMYTKEDEILKNLPHSDITVCNGVCSQLFSVISYFLRSVAASIPDTLFKGAFEIADKLEQKLKNCNDVIVPLIVNSLLKAAGDCVIFGNEYSKEHPVEGAYQCIEAVAKSGRPVKEYEVKWSFNRKENIVYNMLLQVCFINGNRGKILNARYNTEYIEKELNDEKNY